MLLAAVALLLAAAVAIGAFLVLSGSDNDGDLTVQEAMEAAGCTYEEAPANPSAVHIQNPAATRKEWNTDPPTTGPHFGTAAIFGEYEEPIQPARAIHNLEHGGIWITYGDDVPAEEIDDVRRFYRDDPNAMLLSPYPKLGDKIALAAWFQPIEGEEGKAAGVVAKCTRFDEAAFESFRDTYRYKGPERFPPDALEPGE